MAQRLLFLGRSCMTIDLGFCRRGETEGRRRAAKRKIRNSWEASPFLSWDTVIKPPELGGAFIIYYLLWIIHYLSLFILWMVLFVLPSTALLPVTDSQQTTALWGLLSLKASFVCTSVLLTNFKIVGAINKKYEKISLRTTETTKKEYWFFFL